MLCLTEQITLSNILVTDNTICVSRLQINEDLPDSNTEQNATRTLNKLRVTSATYNSMPLAPITSAFSNLSYLK